MDDKLGVYDFGNQLLMTNDLDPVYVLLYKLDVSREKLCEMLIAYWCFYHLGTVSWIVDQNNFWRALKEASKDATHPRATERRHFRGENARKAVSHLRSYRLTASELVDGLTVGEAHPTLKTVSSRVKEWHGFGPWIAFKIADMLERLELASVQFRPSDIFVMFDSPRKGAEEMARRYNGPATKPYLWAYNKLRKSVGHHLAPPIYLRKINIQEVETILCKWHSHLGGHYHVGKDTQEIQEGLDKYKTLPTAKLLLAQGQKTYLWGTNDAKRTSLAHYKNNRRR